MSTVPWLPPLPLVLVMVLPLALFRGAGVDGQDAAQEVRRLRAAGSLAGAYAATDGIDDPALRAYERLETCYHAGDLGGALRHGLEGLEVDPHHLLLLWRASRLAIELAAAELAGPLARDLMAAVEGDPTLSDQERDTWLDQAREHRDQALALEHTQAEVEQALGRARWVVALLGLGALGALGSLVLGARSGRGA